MRLALFLAAAVAALFVLGGTPAHAQDMGQKCQGLRSTDFTGLPDAMTFVLTAEVVAAGNGLPEHCRITGTILPAIGFEMYMPTQGWNGRFLVQGCGGFCGSVPTAATRDALARNYAVTASDMGHRGGSPIDGKWGYNNRAAEVDFAFRATHVNAVAGKALVRTYYGRPANKNYFRGCSTGGRQGMVAAQRYPGDFDGIVAGAPVLNEVGAGALHLIWSAKANLDDRRQPILGEGQAQLLYRAAMESCDAVDGVKDGIIDDPRACRFDPASLQCPAGTDCLNAAQVAAAQKLYGGPKDSQGTQLFPGGLMPGSEINWVSNIIAAPGRPSVYLLFGGDFLKYLAFENDPGPAYDPLSFDFDKDVDRLAYMETLYSASNPDLWAFKNRGGKVILFQGWADQSVTPQGTIDYYEMMRRTMGGEASTTDFARLFMIPGMGHCLGSASPGVNNFDQLTAIENWVEKNEAPEQIIANRQQDGRTMISRPLYPYPAVARHRGTGDFNDAASFTRFRAD